jgi:hypothetical protein
MLSTVSFSDVDTRTAGSSATSGGTGCAGKTLQLNAYGDTSATPLQIATVGGSTAASVATIGITTSTITTSTGFTIAGVTSAGSALAAFDLGINTPSATSGAVYKLTLQSN